MRTYKFRAWDKNFKRMRFKITDVRYQSNENLILMQYTGLKDKNGKEIYERDIIKQIGGRIYTVIFKKAMFQVKNQDDICFPIINDALNWDYRNLEVIGNIHENPKLLNV